MTGKELLYNLMGLSQQQLTQQVHFDRDGETWPVECGYETEVVGEVGEEGYKQTIIVLTTLPQYKIIPGEQQPLLF